MVLGALIALGATFGAAEGIRASQHNARRQEHRTRKNNLVVHVPKSSDYGRLLSGRRVVLSGDKLYVDTGNAHDAPFGHPFEGYYLPYPDAPFSGLVSTITPEAPIMNWIYVHADTFEVKFGTRALSDGHYTGPFDCTRQEWRLTMAGWEGFCAVQEGLFWALYFDVRGDGLAGKVAEGTPVLDIELLRREMRVPRPTPPPPPPPQTGASDETVTCAAAEGTETARPGEQFPPESSGRSVSVPGAVAHHAQRQKARSVASAGHGQHTHSGSSGTETRSDSGISMKVTTRKQAPSRPRPPNPTGRGAGTSLKEIQFSWNQPTGSSSSDEVAEKPFSGSNARRVTSMPPSKPKPSGAGAGTGTGTGTGRTLTPLGKIQFSWSRPTTPARGDRAPATTTFPVKKRGTDVSPAMRRPSSSTSTNPPPAGRKRGRRRQAYVEDADDEDLPSSGSGKGSASP